MNAEKLREWHGYINIQGALHTQLVGAILSIYLRAIKNKNTGFSQKTVCEILDHLFWPYGRIKLHEIEANSARFKSLWDPSTPFQMLIEQIEYCAGLVEAAGEPYSPAKI